MRNDFCVFILTHGRPEKSIHGICLPVLAIQGKPTS